MNNITNANALIAKGATGDADLFNSSLDDILKQLSVNRQHLDLFFSLYIKTLDRPQVALSFSLGACLLLRPSVVCPP